MNWTWLMIALGLAGDAIPSPPPPPEHRLTTITVNNHMVGVFAVGVFTNPGTNMDDFVLASTPTVRQLTEQLNTEVCGSICKNGHQYGVVLTTIKSHAACPILPACPKGMVATGYDLHSHPKQKSYTPNTIDQMFVGKKDVVHTTPDMFSQGDLMHPNAYLVAPNTVLHHDGKVIRVVRPSTWVGTDNPTNTSP